MCSYLLLICVFLASWFTLLVCAEFTYPYLLSTCLIVKLIPPCQVGLRKLRWTSPRLVLMYVTGSIQRKLILPLDGQTIEQASNSAPGTLVDRYVLGWEGRGECQWTEPSLWLSVSLWWNVNFGNFSYWAQGLHYEKITTSAVNTVLVVHRQRQFSLYDGISHLSLVWSRYISLAERLVCIPRTGVHTSDACDIPWHTTRQHCITRLCLSTANFERNNHILSSSESITPHINVSCLIARCTSPCGKSQMASKAWIKLNHGCSISRFVVTYVTISSYRASCQCFRLNYASARFSWTEMIRSGSGWDGLQEVLRFFVVHIFYWSSNTLFITFIFTLL